VSASYTSLGGGPSWIWDSLVAFVHSGNISIAHLNFEEALLSPKSHVNGVAFAIMDPNPAIRFRDGKYDT
jgi:hypothetical protein